MKIYKKYIHQQVKNQLEHLLDTLPSGGRLPSCRLLENMLNANRGIIQYELKKLSEAGRIVIYPRRGIFKCRRRTERNEIWFFCHEHQASFVQGYFNQPLLESLRDLAEADNKRLRTGFFPLEEIRKIPAFIKRHRIQELFLWHTPLKYMHQLAQQYCPKVVAINPVYDDMDGIFAVIDSPAMSAIQLDYLYSLGHRRIGYIHDLDQHRTGNINLQRLSEYYRFMAEHGLKIHPEWVYSCSNTISGLNNQLRMMMQTGGGVTAVICCGIFLQRLYDAAASQLFEPGDKLSIMGNDTLPSHRINFTTVTNSPQGLTRLAWDLLLEAREDLPPRTAETQLKIHTGSTVKHLISE